MGINENREYLERAFYINGEIDSKLEQVSALRAIATKATTTLRIDAGGGGHDNHSMESVIVKIADLENEINAEIDKLIDIKREIGAAIKKIRSPQHRVVLEYRYLCFKKWEQIAVDRNYSMRHVYEIHDQAIKMLKTAL